MIFLLLVIGILLGFCLSQYIYRSDKEKYDVYICEECHLKLYVPKVINDSLYNHDCSVIDIAKNYKKEIEDGQINQER